MQNTNHTSRRTRRVPVRSFISAGTVLVAVALAAALGTAPAQQIDASDRGTLKTTSAGEAHERATLAGVAKRMEFLEGTWIGSMGEDTVEETWSAPNGTHLIGMFRWTKRDGSVMLMELMSIDVEDSGFVMHLRHFDSQLVPWASEEAGPESFRLAKMERNEKVRWEPVDESSSVESVSYHRTGKETMTITVAFDPETDRESLVFEMRLKKTESEWQARD